MMLVISPSDESESRCRRDQPATVSDPDADHGHGHGHDHGHDPWIDQGHCPGCGWEDIRNIRHLYIVRLSYTSYPKVCMNMHSSRYYSKQPSVREGLFENAKHLLWSHASDGALCELRCVFSRVAHGSDTKAATGDRWSLVRR